MPESIILYSYAFSSTVARPGNPSKVRTYNTSVSSGKGMGRSGRRAEPSYNV